MSLPWARRVAVIGLDAAPARLVFDQWQSALPNISRLRREGAWGVLRSCDPPITVPAWACMMSSKDPGQLGLYGFRNRRSYAYDDQAIAHARLVRDDMVWDVLGRAGKRSLLLGVPLTYPPPQVDGWVVSCFLTPSRQQAYTFPPGLRDEVERVVPDYVFDVADFRTADKAALLQRIYAKTACHFRLARHLVASKPWDFFMMVEMGTDRIQHAFWPPSERPDEPAAAQLLDYYRYVDTELGELLALLGDDVSVLVVSDHGAQAMEGGVYINQWLIEHGYLHLLEPPTRATPLTASMVDWSRTRAWGEGGYVGRIYLNVQGREPQGQVEPKHYERLRSEIAQGLAVVRGADGEVVESRALRPDQLYATCAGVAPDLLLYFGELRWRALGSVGAGALLGRDNDRGPDGANHHPDGIVILRPAGGAASDELLARDITDIAPTILEQLGVAIPADMRGRAIVAAPTRLPSAAGLA